MKIYTLTFNDVQDNGFGTYEVSTFLNKEEAVEKMKKEYLEKCADYVIEKPMDDTIENGLSDTYAFISMYYYWDIFETEI